MKNKLLFYLISAACFLSYTSTFTSCINGVDDEYLELQNTDDGNDDKGEELPDINGEYSATGDFDLEMTCNGETLDGKKVTLSVDENNEKASITFAGGEVDLETAIAEAIPGGVGGLISGWGLKYTSYSPVPGQKEITVPNVPLFKNGTQSYMFEGSNIQPTYTMSFNGKIEGEKMTINVNYELTNQTLAGTWDLAPVYAMNNNDNSPDQSPLWLDWDSEVKTDLGSIQVEMLPGMFTGLAVKGKMNGIFNTLATSASPMVMEQIIGIKLGLQPLLRNLLQSVTAESNGGMYAIYSYSGDLNAPQWSGADGMPHDALRYYYDPENPENRVYMEINGSFLIDMIKSLAAIATTPAAPTALTTRSTPTTRDLRGTAMELIALLVPVLEKGLPCDYVLDGDKLSINIDGVLLRDVLVKIIDIANSPEAAETVNGLFASLGNFQTNIIKLLETLPNTLKYHDAGSYDENNVPSDLSGECGYVKLGLKFVKATN